MKKLLAGILLMGMLNAGASSVLPNVACLENAINKGMKNYAFTLCLGSTSVDGPVKCMNKAFSDLRDHIDGNMYEVASQLCQGAKDFDSPIQCFKEYTAILKKNNLQESEEDVARFCSQTTTLP